VRFPIKLNKDGLPKWIRPIAPLSMDDPRGVMQPHPQRDDFARRVSSVKIGTTWRTTRPSRHVSSDQVVLELASAQGRPVILDVGASDGCTSLELIEKLGRSFGRFYVTDASLKVGVIETGGATYFYHPRTGQCIMRVGAGLIVYADTGDSMFPLNLMARSLLSQAPAYDAGSARNVSLVQPELRRLAEDDPRVAICEYDVFQPWTREGVDIVKVANVLNRSYFSDSQIVAAIKNLSQAMKPNGKLLIVDNRKTERVSLLSKQASGLRLEREIHGGANVARLAEGM
jgi:hypothetical protein